MFHFTINMNTSTKKRVAARALRQARCRANLELCATIQVLFWLTVFRSETRPNAKPKTAVTTHFHDKPSKNNNSSDISKFYFL